MGLEAPNSLVLCQACNQLTTPGEDWSCEHCQENCYYGAETRRCPRCGKPALGVRKGHNWSAGCPCAVDPAKLAASEELRRRWQARDRGRDQAAQQARQDKLDAADCWERKLRDCSIRRRKDGPWPFCSSCPKWRS